MTGKIRFFFNPEIDHNIKVVLAKDGNKDLKIVCTHNVCNMGDIVAKVVDNNEPDEDGVFIEKKYSSGDYKPGINVSYDRDRRVFVSMCYGFTTIINNAICVEPPLLINKYHTKAILLVYPNRMRIWPTLDDIIHICNIENIVQIESFEQMKKLLTKLQKGKPRLVKMLIAEGRKAVKGLKAYNKLIVDTEKKAGKEREDGSIDFHEQDSVIQIRKGQEIAIAIPGIKAETGLDIYGSEIATETEENLSYKMGKNIVQEGDKFLSEVEGVLLIDGKKVSISEVLMIQGDVDFHQGNIDFTGSVHITRNVTPGFKVKAQGDIIIDGGVDDAEIIAGGNITISKGVTSQTGKTVIHAGGTVKAKYIMEADVEAKKDVIVEEYCSNANIVAHQNVLVTEKKGQIMGGKTKAKYKIEVVNAGSKNEQATYFYVGKDPEIEEKLNELAPEWEEMNKQLKEIMNEIKNKWDEQFLMQPEEYIAKLSPDKRNEFAPLAKDYGLFKTKFDSLDEKRRNLTIRLRSERPAKVMVHNNTYGGVVLHIYSSVKKIVEKYVGSVFMEENKEVIIRPIN